jgi:hypothetical protein
MQSRLEHAEHAARGCLLLIGSALPRSRGWHVRTMFGIEDFSGKPNGGRTLQKSLHPEHRGD